MSIDYEEGLRRALGPARYVRYLARAGSTNEIALSWANDPSLTAPHGAVVVADEQTSGRGRWGRVWESSAGRSLMFSLIMRPAGLPPARMGLLTAAMGIACDDAIGDLGPLAPTLKWPNDVNIRARKVAGILFENQLLGSEVGVVVAGVGVNTHWSLQEIPEDLRDRATSLAIEMDEPPGRAELLASILDHFEPLYSGVVDGTGIDGLLQRFDELSDLKDQRVDVTWPDGRSAPGVGGSLSGSGSLQVVIDGRIREVDVAEVTRIRAVPR